MERSLQRAFVRLCETSLQLPHRLLLSDVCLRDRQPVDGGSFGEIYKGEHRGKVVALKSLRIFRHREDDAKNRKVSKFPGDQQCTSLIMSLAGVL